MSVPNPLESRPGLDEPEALRLLQQYWCSAERVSALPSERDQNWLVYGQGSSPRYVLKITNPAEGADGVDFQQQMMTRVADAGVPCPRLATTGDGRNTVEVNGHRAWLIDYLPGTALADVSQLGTRLLPDLGRTLGMLSHACADFDHPAAHRQLQWDVLRAGAVIESYRQEVTDPARRILLDRALKEYEERVHPRLSELPQAVIHNDANDHNVLVAEELVSGLLDFGDALHGPVVYDLAVACAYAMLDRDDPQAVAEQITAGFTEQRPLSRLERAVLPGLIRTRLATSVAVSAHQAALEPDDPYLSISEQPAWRLLRHLMGTDP